MAACEAAEEAVWLCNFFMDLRVVPKAQESITLYYDNSGAVANFKNLEATREVNTLSEDITY